MKKLVLLCFVLLLTLSSCAAVDRIEHGNLKKGEEQTYLAFSEVNPEFNLRQIDANLYFRYQNQSQLVPESRTIQVRNSEIAEYALIKELLRGPMQSGGQLFSTFPQGVEVLHAVPIADNRILAVTFSENFLMKDIAIQDPIEETTKRKLLLQALTLSITDTFSYTGIQVFIKPNNENEAAYRLDTGYLLQEDKTVLLPLTREDNYVSNPQNNAQLLLQALLHQDVEKALPYIYNAPAQNELRNMLQDLPLGDSFTVGSGSLYANGQKATLAIGLENNVETIVFPLQMLNIAGVWKAPFEQVQALLALF